MNTEAATGLIYTSEALASLYQQPAAASRVETNQTSTSQAETASLLIMLVVRALRPGLQEGQGLLLQSETSTLRPPETQTASPEECPLQPSQPASMHHQAVAVLLEQHHVVCSHGVDMQACNMALVCDLFCQLYDANICYVTTDFIAMFVRVWWCNLMYCCHLKCHTPVATASAKAGPHCKVSAYGCECLCCSYGDMLP